MLLVLHKETVNHLLENDFSAAEATANGALDINPAYEPILLLLAELYFMSGEYKLAEPLYQALKALLPGEKHIVLRLEEILQK